MTDRPILFSGPMVRALLAGTKSQTRRVVPKQPTQRPDGRWDHHGYEYGIMAADNAALGQWLVDFQSAQKGNRLYVREAWRTVGAAGVLDNTPPRQLDPQAIWYEADGSAPANEFAGKFRQGMHMPRWASRITLTVTDARVQQLQEIGVRDAIAEGVQGNEMEGWRDYRTEPKPCDFVVDPRQSYRTLWDSLNAARGYGWEANPWVVATSFTVALGNIDAFGDAS